MHRVTENTTPFLKKIYVNMWKTYIQAHHCLLYTSRLHKRTVWWAENDLHYQSQLVIIDSNQRLNVWLAD